MSNHSTADVFSRAAPDFDRFGPKFFSLSGHRLVELANISESSHVLDVACGRGSVLFPAAEKVSAHGQIFGVDLADGMIHHTHTDLRNLNIQNISLSQMDASQLAFASETFDCILCSHSIIFFPQALSEFQRVLKPGGKATLSIIASGCFDWLTDIFIHYKPPDELGEENETEQFTLDTPSGMESVLQEAGFTEIETYSETNDMIYPDEEIWWQMLWTLGFRSMLESMSIETQILLKADLAQGLKDFKQSDGFHIPFETIYAMSVRPE